MKPEILNQSKKTSVEISTKIQWLTGRRTTVFCSVVRGGFAARGAVYPAT